MGSFLLFLCSSISFLVFSSSSSEGPSPARCKSHPPEIHKSALGAEDSVAWEHADSTLDAIASLKAEGYTIVSVEQTVHSVKLDSFIPEQGKKYALVFGNEVAGVEQSVVDESDFSLEIPQYGTKHSLNVSVSIGVILWHLHFGLAHPSLPSIG